MSRGRKNAPAPGTHCSATLTTAKRACRDPAVWMVLFVEKNSGDQDSAYACAAHLNRVLSVCVPRAMFSNDMFRVLPLETWMRETRARAAASLNREAPAPPPS